MFLPEGHDPDTLVGAEGAAGFEHRLKDALPLSEYLVQHLSAEGDLDHVDGRAKLKALAMPLFARMPEGIYREMLAEQLAAPGALECLHDSPPSSSGSFSPTFARSLSPSSISLAVPSW